MNVAISTAVVAAIRAHAAQAHPLEACGLLFGEAGRIASAQPCRNVAADPRRRFEIDPAALLAAHRAARGGGAQLIGWYHSHPTGLADPSPEDARQAAADGALWVIVAGTTLRAWRAGEGGARHGRFDPVALRVEHAG